MCACGPKTPCARVIVGDRGEGDHGGMPDGGPLARTHCLTLVHAPVQGNSSSGDIIVHTLQWGPVQIYNTTLTCRAVAVANGTSPPLVTPAAPPPVTLVAETALQLLWGIQILGQLQPSTIILARDMAVPADTWPKGLLVNKSMVLAGLPPPAQRTLLDLYQVGYEGCGREAWGSRSVDLGQSNSDMRVFARSHLYPCYSLLFSQQLLGHTSAAPYWTCGSILRWSKSIAVDKGVGGLGFSRVSEAAGTKT